MNHYLIARERCDSKKPNAVAVVCWASMSRGLIGWGNYTSFFLIWTWSQSLCFWLPILIDCHWVFLFRILNKFSFLLKAAALLTNIHMFKHSHLLALALASMSFLLSALCFPEAKNTAGMMALALLGDWVTGSTKWNSVNYGGVNNK